MFDEVVNSSYLLTMHVCVWLLDVIDVRLDIGNTELPVPLSVSTLILF